MDETFARSICKAYDVPLWIIVKGRKPRLFRIRWMLRRITGYEGRPRRG